MHLCAMLEKYAGFCHNTISRPIALMHEPSSITAETPHVVSGPAHVLLPLVSAPKAILSSLAMTFLFVLGLALIQILFNRATPDGDNIVKALEYCSMVAGYSLLALPMWGIFDTLRRTHLYVTGPKYVIAAGYVGLMGALLYFAYKFVLWMLYAVL